MPLFSCLGQGLGILWSGISTCFCVAEVWQVVCPKRGHSGTQPDDADDNAGEGACRPLLCCCWRARQRTDERSEPLLPPLGRAEEDPSPTLDRLGFSLIVLAIIMTYVGFMMPMWAGHRPRNGGEEPASTGSHPIHGELRGANDPWEYGPSFAMCWTGCVDNAADPQNRKGGGVTQQPALTFVKCIVNCVKSSAS
mmetsp:Transcript_39208/g.73115  ORF Transcript_39208/g.73115 Transcript_39208/m.73115 type:complete len:195 (-) Transcript_39208:196-780(-)